MSFCRPVELSVFFFRRVYGFSSVFGGLFAFGSVRGVCAERRWPLEMSRSSNADDCLMTDDWNENNAFVLC
jgi:hypothetical protein